MDSGIYCILNTKTHKRYIGQTNNFKKRWGIHLSTLNNNKHDNSYLQKSWNKYGENSFEFKIMEYVPVDYLDIREQWWMDLFGSYNREYGYNLNDSVTNNPMKGKFHTDEAKLKISLRAKGRVVSDKTRETLSKSVKGKPRPNRKSKIYTLDKHYTLDNKEISYERNLKYTYYIKSPNNIEYMTYNLAEFCRQHRLTRHRMSDMLRGRTPIYKGWSGYTESINKNKLL